MTPGGNETKQKAGSSPGDTLFPQTLSFSPWISQGERQPREKGRNKMYLGLSSDGLALHFHLACNCACSPVVSARRLTFKWMWPLTAPPAAHPCRMLILFLVAAGGPNVLHSSQLSAVRAANFANCSQSKTICVTPLHSDQKVYLDFKKLFAATDN